MITTKGWDMLVRWKDGSQSWIPLKDVKESNPLETADYAISRGSIKSQHSYGGSTILIG